MDVAPFAHARIAEKMIAAETAQFRLRQILELLVIGLPDVEQGEKIRVRMHKAPVRRIGRGLFLQRTLARILDAQSGRDHEHFAQRFFGARLQYHPTHRRIYRQTREFAADGCECMG